MPSAGGHAPSGVVRLYVPATLPLARAVAESGVIGPAPVLGCAVTQSLSEDYPGADSDELEYAALSAAATGSLRLLAADASAPPRRLVLVVEVPAAQVRTVPGPDSAAVRIETDAPVAKLAAVHVDEPKAEQDVRAALAALPAAQAGDEDAQVVVDSADSHELLWYASQELPDLLDLRGSMNG